MRSFEETQKDEQRCADAAAASGIAERRSVGDPIKGPMTERLGAHAQTLSYTLLNMNLFRSKQEISLPKHNCVLPHALRVSALQKLVGKRVILASNSPRRKDILRTIVGLVLGCTDCFNLMLMESRYRDWSLRLWLPLLKRTSLTVSLRISMNTQ